MTEKTLISHIIATIMMVAVLLCGCVKEIDGGYLEEQEYITFSARMSQDETKATPLTQLSGNAGIIGYIYTDWPSTPEAPWDILKNESYTFDGDQLEPTDKKLIKWSSAADQGKENLRIYAYAPYQAEGMTVSYGSEGSYTLPRITYTSPDDISDQTDLIAATADVATTFNKNIPLTFNHILTAIKFKAGFDCTVNAITLSGIVQTATYTIGEGWDGHSTDTQTYTLTFEGGKTVTAGEMITDNGDANVLFLIPQTLSSDAAITLTYDNDNTVTTSLQGITWEEGNMITYTLHQTTDEQDYIYFDLAAGNVTINATSYSGKVYVAGVAQVVSGTHSDDNRYYVYQSSELKTEYNKSSTGYANATDFENKVNCRIPEYELVKYEGMLWSDWITNNTDVDKVIEVWDDGKNVKGSDAENEGYIGTAVVRDVGRTHTENKIYVSGALFCNLTIDDLYSIYQHKGQNRSDGGITFLPTNTSQSELTINMIGDNRFGCIHYVSYGNHSLNNKLILEGAGSLTAADIDFYKDNNGYYSNHYDSVIGGSDSRQDSWGIVINSGTIFAGSTKAENCSCIGAGGNGIGHVTINGGRVTAVASTTGTAIGGGIGFSDQGGAGYVYINGGNVYAYNFVNVGNIPSSAIGGAGSRAKRGNTGTVKITGGNIYAYSALGTAIGGGSSSTKEGGNADITIEGNATVIANSGTASSGIGGGTGGSEGGMNGGTAKIKISGNPIIRTGSIGGGKTNSKTGYIGSADITISGGDIQAQFVMAAGAATAPSFTMTGGLIRNSDTEDTEFAHIQENGGAVYLEDGSFTMTGGEIRQCLAQKGGAIYVKGSPTTTFRMSGGKITECISQGNGGAVCLEGGNVILSGGELSSNLAKAGNGGGVYVIGGNFSMPEGGTAQIRENAAFSENNIGGNGGGIYVTSEDSDVKVDILSGTITENSSDKVGGGISVDMLGNDDVSALVTIGKEGSTDTSNPSISNNHTIIMGGGLFARGAKANITINGGEITGNTISGYEANTDVANEGGMVTLNGGKVNSVTITYDNNGAYYGETIETAQQKIVTATNSIMVAPAFGKTGYVLSGWNTRPDGKGTSHTNGQIVNLSADLTLYAQWTIE